MKKERNIKEKQRKGKYIKRTQLQKQNKTKDDHRVTRNRGTPSPTEMTKINKRKKMLFPDLKQEEKWNKKKKMQRLLTDPKQEMKIEIGKTIERIQHI